MFQVKAVSHEDGKILNEIMKDIKHGVGDEWINAIAKITRANYRAINFIIDSKPFNFA
jgi:hypothetical protein